MKKRKEKIADSPWLPSILASPATLRSSGDVLCCCCGPGSRLCCTYCCITSCPPKNYSSFSVTDEETIHLLYEISRSRSLGWLSQNSNAHDPPT